LRDGGAGMMNVTRFCALCVPLSVRTLLLVCRGTSSGPMQSARALAAMTMTGASEFQKFRGFFLFQLSSRSNYYTVSYGNANRFLCLTFVSQTLRQADVILWLYFVMTSCIHFTILQLILLY
jgi:hypothetical protein